VLEARLASGAQPDDQPDELPDDQRADQPDVQPVIGRKSTDVQ
jgi:hypothetical protein